MFKDRKKLLEIGKDVLIVLLLVSAVVLGHASGVLVLGRDSVLTPIAAARPESSGVTAAALPYAIAVVPDEYGGRFGLTHGEAAIAETFDRFSAALGEALGSSGTPEEVPAERFAQALSGPGVYFDYLYPQPLSLLACWLGTELTGDAGAHTARRICLAVEDDSLALYYVRARSGETYRCDTALSASTISARIREYTPNGAKLVGELTDDAALDACTLLEEELTALPQLSGTNPLRDTALAAQLPELFSLSGAARSYAEAEGTVYVENDATLRVHATGEVYYRCMTEGPELGGASASTQTVVEAARGFCQRGPGASCGAARLGLSELRYDPEENSYSISFEYCADGVPVRLSDGPAVTLTVRNGFLTEAVLRYRCYTPTEETVTPLPRPLALAAVRSVGGGEPLLCYVDTRRDVMLQWTAA